MPGGDPAALSSQAAPRDGAGRADRTAHVGPVAVRADPAEVEAFARALGLCATYGPVPLTFPMRWLGLPAIREPIARELEIAGKLLVHQSQSFAYTRPLDPDADYVISAEAHRDRSGRIALRATLRDSSGEAVLISEAVVRVVTAAAGGAGPRRRSPFASGEIPTLRVGPIGPRHTERYAAASLDDNPLHSDDEAARAAGLAGPVVHGMMLVGQFERALIAWRADLRIGRCHATFLQPLPVGGATVLEGRVVHSVETGCDSQLVIRLAVQNEAGELLVVGEVEARAPRR